VASVCSAVTARKTRHSAHGAAHAAIGLVMDRQLETRNVEIHSFSAHGLPQFIARERDGIGGCRRVGSGIRRRCKRPSSQKNQNRSQATYSVLQETTPGDSHGVIMRAPGEKVVNSQAARITVLRRSDVADDVTGIVGDVLMDKWFKTQN
jgi:hypothetical protein